MTQELWSSLGHENYLDFEPWPEYDPELLIENKVTIVLQVNGKMRGTMETIASATEEEVKEAALASESVMRAMGSDRPKKIIYVDKKLVNIVV
jgi:leucyl-tRNA synthetase